MDKIKKLEILVLAEMDQLHQMLIDQADRLNTLSKKKINDWDVDDLKLAKFCIHSSAVIALHLKYEQDNNEQETD